MTHEEIGRALCGEPRSWGIGFASYSDMVARCGEVLLEHTDSGYQGDTFALVKGPDGRIGYVEFSWGSCSACDALAACSTHAEVGALAESIREGVRWFNSVSEAVAYLVAAEERNDHTVWSDTFRAFRRDAKGMVGQ